MNQYVARCNAEETIIVYLYNFFPASESPLTKARGSSAARWLWGCSIASVCHGEETFAGSYLHVCELDKAGLLFNKRCHPTGILTLPLF